MKGARLETKFEDINGIRLVHVSGPLDSETHDLFRSAIDPLVNQSRVRIVLDCEKLTYVNSRGLSMLAHYQRTSAASMSSCSVSCQARV